MLGGDFDAGDDLDARARGPPRRFDAGDRIVVGDCETMGQLSDWLESSPAPDLVVRFHEVNRGKGAALRTGFAAATGDVI